MKLKSKSQLTGRELCDLEGIIFNYIADINPNDAEKSKKEAVQMVNENWEDILIACYTNADGSAITDTNVPARMMILQDFDKIIGFVLDRSEDKKESLEGKSLKQIKRR